MCTACTSATVGAAPGGGEERVRFGLARPRGGAFEQQDRRRPRRGEEGGRLRGAGGERTGVGRRRAPARSPLAAVDPHPPHVGQQLTGEQVEEGFGPRPLGPAERQELAPFGGERHALHE